jgi:hypothetical protein
VAEQGIRQHPFHLLANSPMQGGISGDSLQERARRIDDSPVSRKP